MLSHFTIKKQELIQKEGNKIGFSCTVFFTNSAKVVTIKATVGLV